MDVELKNIALIEEGNLELKGITLIADENDSGKSTIGKTLFTTLTTLNNFEKNFLTNLKQRIERIYLALKEILDNDRTKSMNQSILKKILDFSKKMSSFNQEVSKTIKNLAKIEISEKNFINLEILFSILIKDAEVLKNDLIKGYFTESKGLEFMSDQFLIYRMLLNWKIY